MKELNIFKDWINSIPMGDYRTIRSRVIAECYITPQTFRHWKIGTVNVPPLAREKINKIAIEETGKPVFKDI